MSSTVPSAPPKPEKYFLSFLPISSDLFTRNVSEVIIGADFDCTSRTFDLFDVVSEKDSLASFDREDLLWRDDRHKVR